MMKALMPRKMNINKDSKNYKSSLTPLKIDSMNRTYSKNNEVLLRKSHCKSIFLKTSSKFMTILKMKRNRRLSLEFKN
jgi:hypothetical protein